jgi:hypothetical protein
MREVKMIENGDEPKEAKAAVPAREQFVGKEHDKSYESTCSEQTVRGKRS